MAVHFPAIFLDLAVIGQVFNLYILLGDEMLFFLIKQNTVHLGGSGNEGSVRIKGIEFLFCFFF